MVVDTAAVPSREEEEVSKLSVRIASQTLEEPREEENDQPKASKTTPETKKLPQVTEDGRRILFVAATSKAKSVAALIARIIRSEEDKPPVLSAVGAASVNQAVKAIAIARTYLASNSLDLNVDVTRKPQEDVRDVIIFTLDQKPVDDTKPEIVEMKSSAKSHPSPMAGAIAANIREGKTPYITAIGKAAVFKAVCAVSLSKKYLKKEDIDVTFCSQFIQVDFDNGTKANAIQLIVQKI